jgi:hypothetical protein
MRRLTVLFIVLLALAFVTAALAAEFEDYPQFRYASGLPGGTFGVDPNGQAGFNGAMQINIPIGYTPGAGNWALAPSAGAIDGGFPTQISGAPVNGTVAWGFGMFGPDHALWAMDMNTGGANAGESAYNVQFQLKRQNDKWPGISVGILDATDLRPARLSNYMGAGGRSFFSAATWEAGTPEKPLYLTAGVGTRKYYGLFAGASYQPEKRVKLMGEWDGRSFNAGAGYDIAHYSDNWHLIGAVSLIDLDRWNVGFAVTRSSHLTNF